MKKSRFTEEQIISVMKHLEAGRKVAELSREYAVSEATIYAWKAKYGDWRSMRRGGCASSRMRSQAQAFGGRPELGS